MTAPASHLYQQAKVNMWKGLIAVGTNPIKATLVKDTYTPNLLTDDNWTAIAGNEASGSGYTAGGKTVTSPNVAFTAANSFPTLAAVSTPYTVGAIVRPAIANTFLYIVTAGGTSAGSAPAWPTFFGGQVTDNTVTWACIGSGLTQFTGTVPTWSALTSTNFRYVVYRDSVTDKLIAIYDNGSTMTSSGLDFTYTPDATGIAYDYAA